MNFVDSLKKWFFNNSSSAATTTSKVPLVDNTGNPIGCDTLAHLAQVQDLASVMGALRYVKTTTTDDNYDDLDTGIYMGNPSPNRTPCSWSVFFVINAGAARIIILFENSDSPKIWYRMKWGNDWAVDWTKFNHD